MSDTKDDLWFPGHFYVHIVQMGGGTLCIEAVTGNARIPGYVSVMDTDLEGDDLTRHVAERVASMAAACIQTLMLSTVNVKEYEKPPN